MATISTVAGRATEADVPAVVELTEDQLHALIDREARKRLGMSGREFEKRFRQGKLPAKVAALEIGMLLKPRQ
ncbi:MAG: hypothetical protein Q8P22_07640 [Chloroflexota bacterium]|nr:hypothetical protein [Chloroflexota bacterium]